MVRNILDLRQKLLKIVHSSSEGSHLGIEGTMKRLTTIVYWKELQM